MRRLLIGISSTFLFAAHCLANEHTASIPVTELNRFSQIYQQVKNSYVEEISDAELMRYAIKGMIAELDPHSAYLDRQEYEELVASISGEFAGVGLEIDLKNNYITIVTPIDDSSASKQDIRAGDRIIRIDDQPVKGMTLTQVSRFLRGPRNSQVTLTLFREGKDEPLEFKLQREIIKVKSVRSRTLDEQVLYIRISSFQSNTGSDLSKLLDDYLDKNPQTKGVILDLRNNPGGDLHSAITVADSFLEGGIITYTQGRLTSSNVSYRAELGDDTFGLPLVVIINEGSASASEVVAGALQDNERAIIIGTASFGKGSVQNAFPIDEQSALKLTTALYYTPLGRSIQAEGIKPDIEIQKMKYILEREELSSIEADLHHHLNNKNISTEMTSAQRKQKRMSTSELLQEDNQLQEAFNLVKAAYLVKSRHEKPGPHTTANE